MPFGKITQVAHYVPNNIVTNDDLSKIMDTNDEWISSRTGIKERRISFEENTSDLSVRVAEDLLRKSGVSATELDFILVATMTPDFATPSTASLVQGRIGAVNALAFDLSAACSGFVYAYTTAEKFIQSGSQKGIVIGAEVLSKVVDWSDRATAVLFGDGAGGVLIEATEEKHLHGANLQSDGLRGLSLTADQKLPKANFQANREENPFLYMVGRDIFDFATREVPKNMKATLEKSGISADEIDFYLLHQANSRIIDVMARKMKQSIEKFPMNLQKYGNTSAATVPILLSEEVEAGRIKIGSNQKLMLTGFGGGLTWGTLVLSI
ncbi:MAG: ketoacyl-ACP synthase III [Streptococcaceae bacterium]|jgi:3-oxoacyl-[acyl-carrier-protein] synthase-3|nr:ketoacyl-ACP synthase III [Streptococcaceae bacterium]